MSTTQVTPAVELVPPPEMEQQIAARVRKEYEELLLIWKQDELAKVEDKLNAQVRVLFDEHWKKWKEEQKPPTPEQIQLMLSQEYVTFNVPLSFRGSDKTMTNREFTIRELPQSIERKFYRQFKTRVGELAPKMTGFLQANLGKDTLQMMQSFLEAFDSDFDIMADAVVMVLDPYGDEPDLINNQWVQNNIGSQRQMMILKAQVEVNRLRDFFSQLFQAGQSVETITTPLSFQRLLEQSQS